MSEIELASLDIPDIDIEIREVHEVQEPNIIVHRENGVSNESVNLLNFDPIPNQEPVQNQLLAFDPVPRQDQNLDLNPYLQRFDPRLIRIRSDLIILASDLRSHELKLTSLRRRARCMTTCLIFVFVLLIPIAICAIIALIFYHHFL